MAPAAAMPTSSAVLLARLIARTRLRQWQLVCEIAALGSIQKAADALWMSQPTATHALGELERLLGFPLFERHAKGARLTPAGEAVLPRVRLAMNAFAECAEAVTDLLSGSAGEIRVGAIGAAIGGLLSDGIAAFSARHPAIAIHVQQLAPAELLQNLRDGMLDIAIARRPRQLPAETQFEELLADRYAIVCSRQHELAGREGVTLSDLSRQLWLTPPKSTIAERDFQALWGSVESPRKLCWVESRAPLLMWSMVEKRQAITMIPYNTAKPWLANGMLAEIPGDWGPAMQPIGAMYRSESMAEPGPLPDFVAALRAAVPSTPD